MKYFNFRPINWTHFRVVCNELNTLLYPYQYTFKFFAPSRSAALRLRAVSVLGNTPQFMIILFVTMNNRSHRRLWQSILQMLTHVVTMSMELLSIRNLLMMASSHLYALFNNLSVSTVCGFQLSLLLTSYN